MKYQRVLTGLKCKFRSRDVHDQKDGVKNAQNNQQLIEGGRHFGFSENENSRQISDETKSDHHRRYDSGYPILPHKKVL